MRNFLNIAIRPQLRARLRFRKSRAIKWKADTTSSLDEDFLLGTLAPASRASERPIAIACFLLVTFFLDRPLFSVPSFR